jgi:hypothetical protein
MKNVALAALGVALFCSLPLLADEGHHHEEMTEAQLGTVHFPTSCAAAVQKPFERGVALLHSFWYEEAEKQFNSVAKADPTCAIAHWGVAMAKWHQLWNKPDADVIKAGLAEVNTGESLKPKTARENDYIEAIGAFYRDSDKLDHKARAAAYSNAMQKVYQNYPDDHEAAAFYALSLLASEPDEDATFANRKQAAAILEKLFAVEPNHPGVAHYMIHAYDKPQLAQQGLPAARRYSQIAPAAPHALHMPSHIFARVGDWQDDINSNLASVAATRKTAAMHMGGEGHQFHAMDFLVYAYMQTGQEDKARAIVEEVKAMPVTHDMYGLGFDPRSSALTDFPIAIESELHHWKQLAALEPVSGGRESDEASTYYARALGAARSGNPAQAQKDLDKLADIRDEKAKTDKTMSGYIEDSRKVAAAWLAHAQGNDKDALAALRTAADREDSLGEEPGGIPAREMLGEMLLEAKRPQEALAEFETNQRMYPNRFNGLYGAAQAAEALGNAHEADGYYAQLVKNCAPGNSDRPELAHAKALLAKK